MTVDNTKNHEKIKKESFIKIPAFTKVLRNLLRSSPNNLMYLNI